jgi:ATP-binding protein involved in chromosome partitioning
MPSVDQVREVLGTVLDPEIRRPITELKMVDAISVSDGVVDIRVLLTVSGCPMRDEITSRVTNAVRSLADVSDVRVELGVMDDDQRKGLREQLRGPVKDIPFNRPGSTTRIYAVASGKGGVGKSSVTANLAVSLAARGMSVGLIDADIYGHSIPRMLGITAPPTMVEQMMLPPEAHGVRAISMLPFKPGGTYQPIAFRGPMLHRALEQFLTDVYWGDLDVLLLDLPPGTGDIAISTAQLLPQAELLIVTTPQPAASEVAIRAGMLAEQTHQKVAGVIENMSGFPCPHCGEPIDLFGMGGGQMVAEHLSTSLNNKVPLLGRIPFDVRLREGGDAGMPLVISEAASPAAVALTGIADQLAAKPRGLTGVSLGITPAARK